MLANASVNYDSVDAARALAAIQIGGRTIASYDGNRRSMAATLPQREAAFKTEVADALKAAGYPAKADPAADQQAAGGR